MSHEIENAVYDGRDGAGWTGLGQIIDPSIAKDPAKIAEVLNATWTVIGKQCFVKDGDAFIEIPNTIAQTRSDNGAVLSVTSENRYHTENRQPIDILEAFRDELEKENLMISHAAVLKGGQIITVSARVPDLDFTVGTNKDKITCFTSLSTGYDKSHGTLCVFDGIREVCANTHRMNVLQAKRNGTLHAIRASTKMETGSLKNLLAKGGEVITAYTELFGEFSRTSVSDAEVMKFFLDVLGIDPTKPENELSTKAKNNIISLSNAYHKAPGANPGTKWGLYNAVTYYATHQRTVRDHAGDGNDAARVVSNMFGSAGKLKARAAELLAA